MNNKKTTRLFKVYWRIMSYVKSCKILFIYSILAFLFSVYYSLYFAEVQEKFINAMNDGSIDAFIDLSVFSFLFLVIGLAVCYSGYCAKCLLAPYMAKDMSAEVFGKFNKTPLEYAHKNHSGDVVRRIGKESIKSTNDVILGFHQYIINVILIAVIFIYLAYYNFTVAMITIISSPLMLIVSRVFTKRIRKNIKNIFKSTGDMSGFIQESIKNMPTVRAYCLEDEFCEIFAGKKDENNRMFFKNELTANFMNTLNGIISNAAVYVSVFIIGLISIEGRISIGAVMAVIVLIQRVQWSFIDTSERWGKTVESIGMADRIFEILDQKTEREVFYKEPQRVEASKNAVSFQNVSYAYKSGDGAAKEAIKDLSIEVKHGETLAIVGASGAGKSTLAKLILGILAPDSGDVSVCGHVTTGELELARSKTAYIPQIPYLFKGSIEQNISYGKENAEKDEIINAAKSAFAHNFILSLKDGYDTDVGEHGVKLSGGERQRVAIARAILKDAPVMLFDEATSSLDNESERFVQNAIENEHGCRTVIIIAHRFSTVKNADRIAVLDDGKIVELGSHDELLELCGQYKRLYENQAG